jgi:hypothetical protein
MGISMEFDWSVVGPIVFALMGAGGVTALFKLRPENTKTVVDTIQSGINVLAEINATLERNLRVQRERYEQELQARNIEMERLRRELDEAHQTVKQLRQSLEEMEAQVTRIKRENYHIE